MKGVWNPKTKQYERKNNLLKEKDDRPYLDRYAEELGVEPVDLWRNILKNNSLKRLGKCTSYFDFTMLKQTLVEENKVTSRMKEWLGVIDGIMGGKY